MAYKDFDGLSAGHGAHHATTLDGSGHSVQLPDASYVRDADMTHAGNDLVLHGPQGDLVIHDYFANENPPNLVAPDGSTLTPELVHSFAHSAPEFAQNGALDDVTPVGHVAEVSGNATVTHPDGTTQAITNGTPIYEGDVVTTDAHGAVNIAFIDETSFAVSEDARLAIDKYVYDPHTESGSTNFSVLKGVFVFTSGLIGRDDPDSVHIKTPVGSIGIRGTIIAGNVTSGEITVVEGAIVLTDTTGHEMTLATQFETARFHHGEGIENIGQLHAKDIAEKFYVVSQVSPTLFSSINDAAVEQSHDQKPAQDQAPVDDSKPDQSATPADGQNHSDAATTTDATTAANAPALPPVPPPVSALTVTGLNTLATGLGVTMTTTSHDSTNVSVSTTHVTAPATITESVAAAANVLPQAQSNTQTDPNVTGTATTGGGTTIAHNAPPLYHGEAPAAFFASSEGQTFHYNFNKEFTDDGGANNITYQLANTTVTALNAWVTNGTLTTGGWTFNAATGALDLTFGTAFPTSSGTISSLNIEVQAIDAQGNIGSAGFDFSAYNADVNTLPNPYTTDGQVISATTPITSQISSDNGKFFLGDGNDVIILNNSGGSDTASNNSVFLGDGTNAVTVNASALNNQVVGGDGHDTIDLNNAAIKFYGMDGDDDINLVLNGGSTVITNLNTAGSNTVIDGGHSNFKAGLVLNSLGVDSVQGEAGGRGDSLILKGAGTLDFSLINANNHINSIERIDGESDTAAQNIKLDYNDILNVTDDKHALIINLGANDTLTLTGMTGMNKVLDNVNIDDSAQGGTTDTKSYDVYTDGNVTLLIHATGAAAASGVTMDGQVAQV